MIVREHEYTLDRKEAEIRTLQARIKEIEGDYKASTQMVLFIELSLFIAGVAAGIFLDRYLIL